MSRNPQSRSLPSSPNTLTAEPTNRVASVTPPANVRPPVRSAMMSFSQVADAHGVSPTALDALVEQLPVGIWIVDRDGRVAFANEVARALGV